jgi:adenylate kinase
MKVVFIGPPGSGKGTQCDLLSKRLSVPHISTGEMLRNLQGEDAAMVRERIDRGHFAPDDFILQMVSKRLTEEDCLIGYLLDGFPRTLVQAKAFDHTFTTSGQSLDHVIHMSVEPEELIRRLAERKQTGERIDDSAEFIRERFLIYAERTQPLLDHYESQSLVRPVDGMDTPENVFQNICRAVNVVMM